MILENNIGWCDVSLNAIIGCSEVSTGCRACYARNDTPARVHRAAGRETWGPNALRIPVASFEAKIRRLNKLCICDRCHEVWPHDRIEKNYCHTIEPSGDFCKGELRRIRCFSDSNSDWLDERWPVETLARFLKAIHDAPNVDFQLLTKRPENWRRRIVDVWETTSKGEMFHEWIKGWLLQADIPQQTPCNIWLGTSCENQEWADKRIPELLKIPAAVRFVSAEPLLSGINFRHLLGFENADGARVSWIIVGGESGSNARPCDTEWIRDIKNQCHSAGVSVFVKQLGANAIIHPFHEGHSGRLIVLDKKAGNPSEWPEDLSVRQFPICPVAPGKVS
jgi:protein gp37